MPKFELQMPKPDKPEITNYRHHLILKLGQINYNIQIRLRRVKRRLFRILNLGHCDLPFDLAQGGGEPLDFAQDREPVERLVEPFGICNFRFIPVEKEMPYLSKQRGNLWNLC